MSKPPTHKPIARPSNHGSGEAAPPPAASQPPTGATAIARPRNACVYEVKRLASEYQNTIASASGDRRPQVRFKKNAAPTNTMDDTTTKVAAAPRLSAPRGISRDAVRGLRA